MAQDVQDGVVHDHSEWCLEQPRCGERLLAAAMWHGQWFWGVLQGLQRGMVGAWHKEHRAQGAALVCDMGRVDGAWRMAAQGGMYSHRAWCDECSLAVWSGE